MQTRPQKKIDEADIARELENLTPEEQEELAKMKAEWEALQQERDRSFIDRVRTYPWAPEERQALRHCAVVTGGVSAGFSLLFGFMNDVMLRRMSKLHNKAPPSRLLYAIPAALVGFIFGCGVTIPYWMNTLCQLPTPLGITLRSMREARERR